MLAQLQSEQLGGLQVIRLHRDVAFSDLRPVFFIISPFEATADFINYISRAYPENSGKKWWQLTDKRALLILRLKSGFVAVCLLV
jgi:hypothetical protein